MPQGIFDILAPITGLFANCLLHILSFRLFFKGRMLASLLIGFLAGACFFVIFSFAVGINLQIMVEDLVTYILLSYCYFHFVNLGETARRIRLLRELKGSAAGLTVDEMRNRYNSEEMLGRRLCRLLKTGQIILKDGKYFIAKPLILSIARMMLFLKHILLKRGGMV